MTCYKCQARSREGGIKGRNVIGNISVALIQRHSVFPRNLKQGFDASKFVLAIFRHSKRHNAIFLEKGITFKGFFKGSSCLPLLPISTECWQIAMVLFSRANTFPIDLTYFLFHDSLDSDSGFTHLQEHDREQYCCYF